jgi:hypothetical protein
MRHKTATKRNKLSKPARLLNEAGLLAGNVLDYGCGRGDDADRLGCDRFDPYYFPKEPSGQYDTIMCNFVLNVIDNDCDRHETIAKIQDLLTDSGCAYISVRANKKDLRGYTSIGTWQGLVTLNCEVFYKDSGCIIYKVCKDCDVEQKAEIFS